MANVMMEGLSVSNLSESQHRVSSALGRVVYGMGWDGCLVGSNHTEGYYAQAAYISTLPSDAGTNAHRDSTILISEVASGQFSRPILATGPRGVGQWIFGMC